jgi:nitroreductase
VTRAPQVDLSPDELLSTTRAVRKRLDFERPVEREVLDECLALAQQAPNASNSEPWRFLVVTEAETRAKLAECYRTGWAAYRKEIDEQSRGSSDPPVLDSAQYLADRFHEVPAMVLPCVMPRADTAPPASQAGRYGSVIQAAWSFQLAARARGLGTCWTTLHLPRERDAAEVLGIPYERVQQVALITVGYSLGTDFKPGRRVALERIVRYERWR